MSGMDLAKYDLTPEQKEEFAPQALSQSPVEDRPPELPAGYLDSPYAPPVAPDPDAPSLGGTGGGAAALAERFGVLTEVADAHGVSPQQVTLAWQLSLGEHVIPIPGASRPASIVDSARAMDLELTDDEVERISAALLQR